MQKSNFRNVKYSDLVNRAVTGNTLPLNKGALESVN